MKLNDFSIQLVKYWIRLNFKIRSKAESVRGKYEIKYKKIDDIDEYLNGLEPALKLPDDGYICW